MKKILLFLVFTILFSVTIRSVQSGSVTLAWDASPDASVTGYRIYYGVASKNYTNSVTIGNVTNVTLVALRPGVTYWFAATAVDGSGLESDFSNEISYHMPFLNPTLLNVSHR